MRVPIERRPLLPPPPRRVPAVLCLLACLCCCVVIGIVLASTLALAPTPAPSTTSPPPATVPPLATVCCAYTPGAAETCYEASVSECEAAGSDDVRTLVIEGAPCVAADECPSLLCTCYDCIDASRELECSVTRVSECDETCANATCSFGIVDAECNAALRTCTCSNCSLATAHRAEGACFTVPTNDCEEECTSGLCATATVGDERSCARGACCAPNGTGVRLTRNSCRRSGLGEYLGDDTSVSQCAERGSCCAVARTTFAYASVCVENMNVTECAAFVDSPTINYTRFTLDDSCGGASTCLDSPNVLPRTNASACCVLPGEAPQCTRDMASVPLCEVIVGGTYVAGLACTPSGECANPI